MIGTERPLVGQHGHGLAGEGMGGEQGQGGLPDVTGEATVGVRPKFTQGEREADHEVVEGAATPGGRIGVDRVGVVALPREIRRQAGTPAGGAPAEGEGHRRGAEHAR
ncbi:hypothetical protein D3C79_630910 [compost metagenome]